MKQKIIICTLLLTQVFFIFTDDQKNLDHSSKNELLSQEVDDKTQAIIDKEESDQEHTTKLTTGNFISGGSLTEVFQTIVNVDGTQTVVIEAPGQGEIVIQAGDPDDFVDKSIDLKKNKIDFHGDCNSLSEEDSDCNSFSEEDIANIQDGTMGKRVFWVGALSSVVGLIANLVKLRNNLTKIQLSAAKKIASITTGGMDMGGSLGIGDIGLGAEKNIRMLCNGDFTLACQNKMMISTGGILGRLVLHSGHSIRNITGSRDDDDDMSRKKGDISVGGHNVMIKASNELRLKTENSPGTLIHESTKESRSLEGKPGQWKMALFKVASPSNFYDEVPLTLHPHLGWYEILLTKGSITIPTEHFKGATPYTPHVYDISNSIVTKMYFGDKNAVLIPTTPPVLTNEPKNDVDTETYFPLDDEIFEKIVSYIDLLDNNSYIQILADQSDNWWFNFISTEPTVLSRGDIGLCAEGNVVLKADKFTDNGTATGISGLQGNINLSAEDTIILKADKIRFEGTLEGITSNPPTDTVGGNDAMSAGGTGGDATLGAGSGNTTGTGGDACVVGGTGGTSDGVGGKAKLIGGTGGAVNGAGGDVIIRSGTGTGSGSYGKINIRSGAGTDAAVAAGDIGLSASNDVIVKANDDVIVNATDDVFVNAGDLLALTAVNVASLTSTNKDVFINADIDGGSTGKVNIRSGTTSSAAVVSGDIGLSAAAGLKATGGTGISLTATTGTATFTGSAGDVTVESTDKDVFINADTNGGSTGKIHLKSGTTSSAAVASGDIGLSANNDVIVNASDDVFVNAGDLLALTAVNVASLTSTNNDVFVTSSNFDIKVTANDNLDLSSNNAAALTSNNKDVFINADIDGGSTGKVNIRSGTTSSAAVVSGDIGLSAAAGLKATGGTGISLTATTGTATFTGSAGDVTVESTDKDVFISADTNGGSTGKVNIRSGTTTSAATSPGDIGLAAKNDVNIFADVDGSGGGKVDIQSGTSGMITTLPGDIGLLAAAELKAVGVTGVSLFTVTGSVNLSSLGGNIEVESTDNDVNICADTSGNSIGKVNIKAGTTISAGTAKGDIGLSADNNIVFMADKADFTNVGTVDFTGVSVDGLSGGSSLIGNPVTIGGFPGSETFGGMGGSITVVPGAGDPSSPGGNLLLASGVGGDITGSGKGGDLLINGGNGGQTSGEGGSIYMAGGKGNGEEDDGIIFLLTGLTGDLLPNESSAAFSPALSSGDIGLKATGKVEFQGNVDFTNATVTGLVGGGDLTGTAGTGSGAGDPVTLAGGVGGATGDGGTASLVGGAGGSTSGNGGAALLTGGDATDGMGGDVNILAGASAGTNKNGGSVTIKSTAATGSGTDGTVEVTSGVRAFGSGDLDGFGLSPGDIGTAATGSIHQIAGDGGTNGDGSNVSLYGGQGGTSSGNGGSIVLTAGDSSMALGGNITLIPGAGTSAGDVDIIGQQSAISLLAFIFNNMSRVFLEGLAPTLSTNGMGAYPVSLSTFSSGVSNTASGFDGGSLILTYNSITRQIDITGTGLSSTGSIDLGGVLADITTMISNDNVSFQWLLDGSIEVTITPGL